MSQFLLKVRLSVRRSLYKNYSKVNAKLWLCTIRNEVLYICVDIQGLIEIKVLSLFPSVHFPRHLESSFLTVIVNCVFRWPCQGLKSLKPLDTDKTALVRRDLIGTKLLFTVNTIFYWTDIDDHRNYGHVPNLTEKNPFKVTI